MIIDKRWVYGISAVLLSALLLFLFIPSTVARLVAAIFLTVSCVAVRLILKKRSIPSINSRQVAFIVTVFAILSLTLLYLTGLEFGFGRISNSGFKPEVIFKYTLPIIIIIITTELIRGAILASECRWCGVAAFLIPLAADFVISGTVGDITSFSRFMDVIATGLLPAIVANLTYTYLARRYGSIPNIIYRSLMSVYVYVLPVRPLLDDALLSLFKLIVPVLLYAFIDLLYEKKVKLALGKRGDKVGVAISVVIVALMISVVMLISCQFKYGALVIGTGSMTGELNRGDVSIYEQYTDQTIEEGQVIVFKKERVTIIHRVVDIKNINGVTRYYTKGDANDDMDSGFITDENVVGLVRMKVPYIGYPTIWLRGLVSSGLGD